MYRSRDSLTDANEFLAATRHVLSVVFRQLRENRIPARRFSFCVGCLYVFRPESVASGPSWKDQRCVYAGTTPRKKRCGAATASSLGSAKRAPASSGAAPGINRVISLYRPGRIRRHSRRIRPGRLCFLRRRPGAAIGSLGLANLTPGYLRSLLRS